MKRTFAEWAGVLTLALALAGGTALAEDMVQQRELTAKQVESFIAAQKDMAAATKKLPEPAPNQPPDPKIKEQLDGIAKQHGFKSFDDYDDVASNIAMVMSGFDPDTKKFVTPQEMLKRQIGEVTADKSIPKADKTRMLEDLNAALKSAQPIQYPGNIKLVEKYFDKLDAVLN